MANQPINLGTAPLGDDGDTVRQAFTKVNANADELYAASGAAATKLATIATGATANATDAQLRDRATHTGTQAISTVSGLQVALDGKQPSNANLTALSGLTGLADRLPYFTGAGALSVATLTAKARGLLASADEAAMRTFLGLGSAAVAAVTTSTADTTAGRVLKVGDFGLGNSTSIALTSWDALTVTGFYLASPSTPGTPPVAGAYYTVRNQTLDGTGSMLQEAFRTDSARFYFRRREASGTFGGWVEVLTQRSILGTVSQSGGVPTGAIIERGSNANGRFTKYADGTVFMDNSGGAITTNPVTTVGTVTSVDSNKLRYGYWY